MKTMVKVLRSTLLATAFVLFFAAPGIHGASNAFKLTGLGGGYSFLLKDVRYQESGQGYVAPKMGPCLGLSFGLVTDGHIGIILDGSVQLYDEVYHNLTDVGEPTPVIDSTALIHFGASLEYSFFRDVGRVWNPYVSFGGFFLVPLDVVYFIDGSSRADYPRKGEKAGFQASAGTRIRMSRSVCLNPRVVYYSGISVVSFQVGIDLIFPKKSPPDPDLPLR